MSTWVVLVCVVGIILIYVFRVLFARWYYRRCTLGLAQLRPEREGVE
jgi:hypothetical protein